MMRAALLAAALASGAAAGNLRGTGRPPPASNGAAPAGVYRGSKAVLGREMEATVAVLSDKLMDLTITGAVDISCSGEAYTYDGVSTIRVDNLDSADDCVHKALSENGVTLRSIVYDAAADVITVSVQRGRMSVDVDLAHPAGLHRAAARIVRPPTALSEEPDARPLGATPAGTYSGEAIVFGERTDASVTVVDAATVDVRISGLISLSCPGERYTLDERSGAITLDNLGSADDCVAAALGAYGLALEGMAYDGASDVVTVTIAYAGLAIPFVLRHQADRPAGAAITVVAARPSA